VVGLGIRPGFIDSRWKWWTKGFEMTLIEGQTSGLRVTVRKPIVVV